MIAFCQGYYGWLGNQMFQYAATRALSLDLNTKFHFPSKKPDLHSIFNTKSPDPIDEVLSPYHETKYSYIPLPKKDNLVFYGYYQSEKYFKHQENIIRQEFTFKEPSNKIMPGGCIALHVRRGDYLNLKDHHPTCSMEYYNKAISIMPKNEIMVFSDDIKWCKENFIGDRFVFSEGNSFKEDLEDMTKCSYHIIANSSFSWWGAWLAESKLVVAPAIWHGPAVKDKNPDIYCEGWIKC